MSLINDALKRAKQAQKDATPAPTSPSNADLRPVEPRQYSRPAVGLAIPALLGIASLLLLFLLWQAARNAAPSPAFEVNARSKTTPAPASPAPEAVAGAPVETAPAASTPSPMAAAAAPLVSVQAASNNPPISGAFAPEQTTNSVPAVVVSPPKPASLPRLQAIVSHPTRPSVIINGKTLFLGDKVGEYRVRTIDQESVTLVGGGQTNILTLPE